MHFLEIVFSLEITSITPLYTLCEKMFTIGLVGATNAGKSTLFNRLIGQFRAIVTDIHGTTRDILYHETELEGIGPVRFADSPGLLDFSEEIQYIKTIIDQADLLLFVIDDTAGLTAKEQHIAEYIRAKHKQKYTILVVNKLDVKWKVAQLQEALADYYGLWFPLVTGVSAKNALHMEILEDEIVKLYKQRKKIYKPVKEKKPEVPALSLAILGRPNAGKSTLLNTLVGKELAKVAEIAGTTRDYVQSEFFRDGKRYMVYDTAGIRKRGSNHGIEKIAYDKTVDMLKYVRPTVLYVIDVSAWLTHRDLTLIEEVDRLALPLVIALNKVDLLDAKQQKIGMAFLEKNLPFARYVPILPLSGKTWVGIKPILDALTNAAIESTKRIDTNKLNTLLREEMSKRPPRFPKNKICKLLYATQIDINAPTFLIFVNRKDRGNFSFKRWIENTLRSHYGFIGVPLVIKFRQSGEGERLDDDEEEVHSAAERIEKTQRKKQERKEHHGEQKVYQKRAPKPGKREKMEARRKK